MRWERLFGDLEGQLDAHLQADRDAEVTERLRAERARITLTDRFIAHEGEVTLVLTGGRLVEGPLLDAGQGWVVVAESPARPVLVATGAVVEVRGLGRAAAAGQAGGLRLPIAHPLRRLARDREPVAVEDVLGRTLIGTIDAVGADAFELAQHPRGATPRRRDVTARPLVAFAAIVCLTAIGAD